MTIISGDLTVPVSNKFITEDSLTGVPQKTAIHIKLAFNTTHQIWLHTQIGKQLDHNNHPSNE